MYIKVPGIITSLTIWLSKYLIENTTSHKRVVVIQEEHKHTHFRFKIHQFIYFICENY